MALLLISLDNFNLKINVQYRDEIKIIIKMKLKMGLNKSSSFKL